MGWQVAFSRCATFSNVKINETTKMVAIKSHNRNLFALDKHGEVLVMDSTGIFRVISKKDLFWNIVDSNSK